MPVVRRVAATLLIGVAACTSASDDASETDTARPPVTGDGAAGCVANSATVRRQTPAGSEQAFLVDAQVADAEGCFDEITFEFRSDGQPLPPGYAIEYREGPFVDFTSGDEFEPAGEAYLVLRFTKTSVFAPAAPGAEPEPTYTGPESIAPSGMNYLEEARIVQGSEGVIQWVIGLSSKRPFSLDGSTLPLLPPPESTTATTTTSPSGSSSTSSTTTTSTTTTTASPPTSTTFPTTPTAKIVVRIG